MAKSQPVLRAHERWSEAQARRALEQCEREGITLHAYAREHGIAGHRLYYWRKRLGKPKGVTPLALVPARVLGSEAAAVVVLRLPNEVAIEVVDGSPSWVAGLVRELLGRP